MCILMVLRMKAGIGMEKHVSSWAFAKCMMLALAIAFGIALAWCAPVADAAEPDYDLYKPVLQDAKSKTWGERGIYEYSVFDIDRDGTAELILIWSYHGNVGASWLKVYTISGAKAVKIYEKSPGVDYHFYAKGVALYYSDPLYSSRSRAYVAGRVTKAGNSITFSSSYTGASPSNYINSVGASELKRAELDDYSLLPGWKKDSRGWWYRDANGGYPVNAWRKIGGSWYRFDPSGYVQTGWAKDGGRWYYLKDSGAMATGWYKGPSSWYLFGGDGAMLTGWQKSGGKWYYLDKSSGAMQASKWIGNYYVQADGSMAVDKWIGRYHVGSDGKWDRTASYSR